jgi:hypothetical protein
VIADLGAGARFLTAVSEISEVGGHLGVRMGTAHVDLKLISEDAIYGDDEGSEHLGEWVILWFQETEPHPTPRQRFHLDVQVPTTSPSNASPWPLVRSSSTTARRPA